jgi:transglutaminase-like putative cysteine protease
MTTTAVGSTTRRRAASKTALPPHQVAAECCLALVSAAVVLTFTRLFDGGGFVFPLLIIAGATHLWLATARRRGFGLGLGAAGTALGFVVLASWLIFGSTTRFLLPTTTTASTARSSLTNAWTTFQQVVAPTKAVPGFVLIAAIALCFAVFLADWAAFRLWAPLEALVPSLTLFGFASFMGSSRIEVFATTVYAGAALLFVLEHRVTQRERTTTWLANQVTQGSSWLIRVGTTAVLVASAAGLVVGPHLPGANRPGVVHLRGNGSGDTARVTISPLVDIHTKLVNQADTVLFEVDSNQPAYWRLTSLDTFDGSIWRSSGRYDSANGSLSGALPKGVPDPGQANDVNQTFTILALDQLWLPAAYVPVSVKAQGFPVRYQNSSSTLIVDTGLANSNNQSYRVRSVLPRYTSAELRSASTAIPDAIRAHDLSVPGLSANARAVARQVTATARTPYDKAMALQNYFRNPSLFTYDTSVPFANDANAIDTFLRERRGYCQQFAGTFAALARAVGLPTRVAVGFTPGTIGTSNPQRYVVRGADAHAWPEVYLGQYGWVPFEPTPGRGAPGEQGYLGIPPAQGGGQSTGPTATPNTSVTTSTAPPTSLPSGKTNKVSTQPQTNASSGNQHVDVRSWTWLGVLVLTGLVVIYLVVVPLLSALARRRRRARAEDPRGRVRVAWLESEESLLLLGAARRTDETTSEFADRAATRLPTERERLTTLAGIEDAAVFGAAPLGDDAVATAESTAEHLHQVVVDQVPRWRRLLVHLDPRRMWLTPRRAPANETVLSGPAEAVAAGAVTRPA